MTDRLTIFDEAENGTMLEGDVHVKVLYIDIHLINSLLIFLTLLVELLDHFLQVGDLLGIFCNTSGVSKQQLRGGISNGYKE